MAESALDLHLARHFGVTPPLGATYAEAAAVCLSRHHRPPSRAAVLGHDDTQAEYDVLWNEPSQRQILAWANRTDATELGAYSVVLAALEVHHHLVAIARAAEGSGADYFVGPPGSEVNVSDHGLDLEDALRLEVSGTDSENAEHELRRRINRKVNQVLRGASDVAGLAGVVAFHLLRIVFRRAE